MEEGDALVLHVASDSDRPTSQHHKMRKHIRVFSASPFLLTVLCVSVLYSSRQVREAAEAA